MDIATVKQPQHPGKTFRELGRAHQQQLGRMMAAPLPRIRKARPDDFAVDSFARAAGGVLDDAPRPLWRRLLAWRPW